MNTFVVLSEKIWHNELYETVKSTLPENRWIRISERKDFNVENLNKLKPNKIFIPHWSYIIPEQIFNNFECVVFHMTDLPFGRGGSPLQNLIVRGYKETKVSALKVEKGLDTGPIYLKEPLMLIGSAEEIFIRASKIIEQMIIKIIHHKLVPIPQTGKPTIFKRRKPRDGNIQNLENIDQIYDYIRMLDADGYPSAFLEFGNFKLEFSRVSVQSDKLLLADVRIIKK